MRKIKLCGKDPMIWSIIRKENGERRETTFSLSQLILRPRGIPKPRLTYTWLKDSILTHFLLFSRMVFRVYPKDGLVYRARKYGLCMVCWNFFLRAKQQQEQISPNHVQAIFSGSVYPALAPLRIGNNSQYLQVYASLRKSIIAPRGEEEGRGRRKGWQRKRRRRLGFRSQRGAALR